LEAKYTESKTGLDEPFGDGPWTFSNGLSNTFRVETFNVNSPGTVESFFIQGGLRWQNLKLLTEGSVRICQAGIRSQNDRTAVDKLPGYFESSNNLYNEIWALGPRTVQQACIAADTAPSTWEVTGDGVYLRGQQPAQSVAGASFSNYTMTFQTNIVRGGTGWKHSVCLDGAKRDRLVWSGDFVHTYRVIQSSTYRSDFITGSLEYWIGRQAPDSSQYAGYFSMSPAMGQSAKYVDTYASFGLLDYQLFLLNVFAGHYRNSGDKAFVTKHWAKIKKGQSITGSAWAILAGVANATQAESSLAALSSLRLGIGYKTTSSVANASSTNLAPFLTGFLLEAIMQESRNSPSSSKARTTAIGVLLDQLWAAMVTQNEYYTGTTWEYLYPDGRPGLDFYTSHAHPWAAAPTYVFSEYVLGVQATSAGFSEWEFRPAMLDVNLSWARGRVPTPQGPIQASWQLNETSVQLSVCGPSGTEGV
ncbi:hypothetical protein ASPNIDRAFT_131668, partial [Aspergillus niger ATCC 1015]